MRRSTLKTKNCRKIKNILEQDEKLKACKRGGNAGEIEMDLRDVHVIVNQRNNRYEMTNERRKYGEK